MKKVSIFVDVQNIYYTTKQAFNSNFDYNKFWKKITYDREVVVAFAYTTNRNDAKQIQFQNILRGIGFNVKLKPYISRADGSSKGDWDVGITIDILDYAPKSDIVVLASGDGDFDLLIQKVESQGVQSKVFGVAALTAKSLIDATSQFMPIDESFLI